MLTNENNIDLLEKDNNIDLLKKDNKFTNLIFFPLNSWQIIIDTNILAL